MYLLNSIYFPTSVDIHHLTHLTQKGHLDMTFYWGFSDPCVAFLKAIYLPELFDIINFLEDKKCCMIMVIINTHFETWTSLLICK